MPTIVENREILIDNSDKSKSKEQQEQPNVTTTSTTNSSGGGVGKKMNKSLSTGSILAINGPAANSSHLSDISSTTGDDSSSILLTTASRSTRDVSRYEDSDNTNNNNNNDNSRFKEDNKSFISTSTSEAAAGGPGQAIKWSKSFESTLIAMHRFLKDNNIYKTLSVDPDLATRYSFRTVYLTRTPFGYHYHASRHHQNTNEFGFNLQTYGLLNSLTRHTEYICFVNNVQAKSAAKRAGLANGDVLIAVDGRSIDSFKQFNEIVKHVKGKQELCLTLLPESSCRRIQCELRKSQVQEELKAKRAKLSQLIAQQDEILGKYQFYKDLVLQHQNQQVMQSSLASSNSFSSSSSVVSGSNINSSSKLITSYSTGGGDPSDSGFISPISNALAFDTTSNQSDFSSSLAPASVTTTSNAGGKNPIVALKNYYSTPIDSTELTTTANNINSSTSGGVHSVNNTSPSFDDTSSIQDSAYMSSSNNQDESATNTSSSSPVLGSKSDCLISNQPDLMIAIPPVDGSNAVSGSVSDTSLPLSDNKNSSESRLSSTQVEEGSLKLSSTSSSSSSQLVKQTTKTSSNNIAKKCLEKTNRLIRSASTSSMNLINKLSSSGSSTQNLDTIDTATANTTAAADSPSSSQSNTLADQLEVMNDESKPKILAAAGSQPPSKNGYIVKVNNTKSSSNNFFAKKRLGSVTTTTSTSGSGSIFGKLNNDKNKSSRKMSETTTTDGKSQHKKQMFSILSSRPKIAATCNSSSSGKPILMAQSAERSKSLAPPELLAESVINDSPVIVGQVWGPSGDEQEYLNSMLAESNSSKQHFDYDELNNSSLLLTASSTSSFLNASSKSAGVLPSEQPTVLSDLSRRPKSLTNETESSSDTVVAQAADMAVATLPAIDNNSLNNDSNTNNKTDEYVVTRL